MWAHYEPIKVGCRGFAGLSLCRFYTQLDIPAAKKNAIKSTTEAAEMAMDQQGSSMGQCCWDTDQCQINPGWVARGCMMLKDLKQLMTSDNITNDVSQHIPGCIFKSITSSFTQTFHQIVSKQILEQSCCLFPTNNRPKICSIRTKNITSLADINKVESQHSWKRLYFSNINMTNMTTHLQGNVFSQLCECLSHNQYIPYVCSFPSLYLSR